MKLASLHIICEYKKRAVAPGIRPSTSTLHYTLTTYGEKFLRTVENEFETKTDTSELVSEMTKRLCYTRYDQPY